MLSKITGRGIPEEAKAPTLNLVLRARDLRWNWLGHILRMDESRLVRKVLLQCFRPTPESIFGDVLDLDVLAAIHLANDRIEWEKNRPSKRC